MGSSFLLNWNDPLGFDVTDVWSMTINLGPYGGQGDEQQLVIRRTLARIEEAVQASPDVEVAGMQTNVPYTNSRWRTSADIDGETIQVGMLMASRRSPELLRLELVEGRFFAVAKTVIS
jgi:hypothetical protein